MSPYDEEILLCKDTLIIVKTFFVVPNAQEDTNPHRILKMCFHGWRCIIKGQRGRSRSSPLCEQYNKSFLTTFSFPKLDYVICLQKLFPWFVLTIESLRYSNQESFSKHFLATLSNSPRIKSVFSKSSSGSRRTNYQIPWRDNTCKFQFQQLLNLSPYTTPLDFKSNNKRQFGKDHLSRGELVTIK